MNILEMTPRRPHLFQAIYDWLLENDLTPYILVNANYRGVNVPREFVQDGEIVLNIHPDSVGNYLANSDRVEFNARFSGVSQHIIVPMGAIHAIYAKENGVGLGFEDEPKYIEAENESDEVTSDEPSVKHNPFTIVK